MILSAALIIYVMCSWSLLPLGDCGRVSVGRAHRLEGLLILDMELWR